MVRRNAWADSNTTTEPTPGYGQTQWLECTAIGPARSLPPPSWCSATNIPTISAGGCATRTDIGAVQQPPPHPNRRRGDPQVVVVGDAVTGHDGRITATRGFYIDVTEGFAADLQLSLNEKLDEIVAHREVIDLAKGMIMAIYRITPDAAFDVLKWRSQELNVKLFTVAERLVAELPGSSAFPCPPARRCTTT